MNKEECISKLKKLDNIGKSINGKVKGSENEELKGIIVDEVSHLVDENKYVIQKIHTKEDDINFRIGYYTCDANYTKLFYGGYSPIMSSQDFKLLLSKAKENDWL